MYLLLPRYFMRKLARKNLTGKEAQVLFVVLDKLLGYSKERNRGKTIISASYILQALNVENPKSQLDKLSNVLRTLKSLEEKHILHRQSFKVKRKPCIVSLHSSMLDETTVNVDSRTTVKADIQIKIREKKIMGNIVCLEQPTTTPVNIAKPVGHAPLLTDWGFMCDTPETQKQQKLCLEEKWRKSEKAYTDICREKRWGVECEKRYLDIALKNKEEYESYMGKMK